MSCQGATAAGANQQERYRYQQMRAWGMCWWAWMMGSQAEKMGEAMYRYVGSDSLAALVSCIQDIILVRGHENRLRWAGLRW